MFLFTISTIERKCDRTALFKSYVFTTVVRSYLMCHHIESRHHMSRIWKGINIFAQLFHVYCRWVFADKVVSYKRYDLWRNKTLGNCSNGKLLWNYWCMSNFKFFVRLPFAFYFKRNLHFRICTCYFQPMTNTYTRCSNTF